MAINALIAFIVSTYGQALNIGDSFAESMQGRWQKWMVKKMHRCENCINDGTKFCKTCVTAGTEIPAYYIPKSEDRFEIALFGVIKNHIIRPVAIAEGMKDSKANEFAYRTMLQIMKDMNYKDIQSAYEEGLKMMEAESNG